MTSLARSGPSRSARVPSPAPRRPGWSRQGRECDSGVTRAVLKGPRPAQAAPVVRIPTATAPEASRPIQGSRPSCPGATVRMAWRQGQGSDIPAIPGGDRDSWVEKSPRQGSPSRGGPAGPPLDFDRESSRRWASRHATSMISGEIPATLPRDPAVPGTPGPMSPARTCAATSCACPASMTFFSHWSRRNRVEPPSSIAPSRDEPPGSRRPLSDPEEASSNVGIPQRTERERLTPQPAP